jgi:hypothetical protein
MTDVVRCLHCGETFADAEAHSEHLSREGWFEAQREAVAAVIEVTAP